MESTGEVPSNPAADEELHRRLVYGDESALAEVYAAYLPLVRRIAVRVTRTPGAAEDVAQEVFAQLWSRPYAYDPGRGTLRTWLSLLAHRRAVDWVRGEARHRKHAHADDDALRTVPEPGPGSRTAARGGPPRLLRGPHLGSFVWITGRTKGRCLRCGVRPGRWWRSSRSGWRCLAIA